MRVVQNLGCYCDLWTTPKKQRITDALGLTIILQKYHHEKAFWRNVGRVAYWLITFKILPLLSHAFWLLFPRVRFIDCSRSFATKKGACIRPLVSQILLKVQPFLSASLALASAYWNSLSLLYCLAFEESNLNRIKRCKKRNSKK